MLKNTRLFWGTAVFLFTGLIIFFVNYQIDVNKRLVKPIQPPFSNASECGIENCHGLNITCGPNTPELCSTQYALGDNCRKFASCQLIDKKCQLVKNIKFGKCKSCVERCSQLHKDDTIKAFNCESECGEKNSGFSLKPTRTEVKYCLDYTGEILPDEQCLDLDLEARVCIEGKECMATCAWGCVNRDKEPIIDCEAIPQYECECIEGFCQKK